MTALSADRAGKNRYRHEAMFYVGHEEYLAMTVPLVRSGVAADEPVLVVTGTERLELLRAAIRPTDQVTLADIGTVGHNPGRIIAVWSDSHPYVTHGASRQESRNYQPIDQSAAFMRALSPAPADAEMHQYDAASLGHLRAVVGAFAAAESLTAERVADFVLAVNEVATNSVQHGGGSGELRLWTEFDRISCEAAERGHVTRPLIGRLRPAVTTVNGRGLWMANQLCDLVQIRSSTSGTTIRMHLNR